MIRSSGGYEDPDDFEDEDEQDLPQLLALGRLIAHARRVAWFSRIGDFWSKPELDLAQAYVDQLGFPEMTPLPLRHWSEAVEAAENQDWNAPAWEAEESLRAQATQVAVDLLGEEVVEQALTHVAAELGPIIGDAVENAAEKAGFGDAETIRAATGAAVQSVHLAALALLGFDPENLDQLAPTDDENPLNIRFRLFEAGRWPVALVGGSFYVF